MKNVHKPLRTLVNAAVVGIVTASAAHAGGFSLYTESSPAATGNFAAGVAAEGADASIGWYNPAGLVLIHEKQSVFGGVGVFPKVALTGSSTFRQSSLAGTATAVETYSDLKGADNGLVPSFHYALPVSDNTTFGVSMVSPFGLATDWKTDSPVRYQGTYTEIITTNLSPEFGTRLSDNFSFGAGLDLQYARVKFNRMLGNPVLSSIIASGNPYALDTESFNKGNSLGIGFHTGVMAMFNDNRSRIGLNYQSTVRHKFHGFSRLTGLLANNNENIANPLLEPTVAKSTGLSSNSIHLPNIVTLSGFHNLNEKIDLLGSVVYSGWGSFKTIRLNNVVAPSVSTTPATFGNITQVRANSSTEQNYKDAWRFSVGANYHVNDVFMLRAGTGFDQTPTNDVDRDVRLPDASRYALSVGAHYQMRENLGMDIGYTHLFSKNNSGVNKADAITPTSSFGVNATSSSHADLVGAQLVWTMDKPVVVTK